MNRQVPVYDSTGQPRFESRTSTFTTERYGKILGGITGGAAGAGVGLAAGVAVGLSQKMLASGPPDTGLLTNLDLKTSALKRASAALTAVTKPVYVRSSSPM